MARWLGLAVCGDRVPDRVDLRLVYILSLKVRDLRTFETAEVRFNSPPEDTVSGPSDSSLLPNVNLLLGDNGSGKTTILRAIALAALAPVLSSGSGFVPFSLVRRTSNRQELVSFARITAELMLHGEDGWAGQHEIETRLERTRGWVDRFKPGPTPVWAEAMWDEASPGFLMVGYGASRRVDPNAGYSEELRQKSRVLRYSRVAGLFEEAVTMVPLSAWLPRLRFQQPELHAQVIELLNRLIAPHAELNPELVEDGRTLRVRDAEYLFRAGGSDVPFQALSDGFRAYIGWIADLLYHLSSGAKAGARLVDKRGVVLVDEVDLHLHPEWQQTVIPTLARNLPNLQFVLTSHSPLLVGTVRGANVFVLEAEEEHGVRRIRLRPSEEEVYGLSADQILTSGHFGLKSTRDPRFANQLQEQARAASEGDPDAAVQFLRLMSLGAGGEEPSPAGGIAPKAQRAKE